MTSTVEQATRDLMNAVIAYEAASARTTPDVLVGSGQIIRKIDALIAAVRAEQAADPAALSAFLVSVATQEQTEKDHGAELIHQVASPLVESEPRLNLTNGELQDRLQEVAEWIEAHGSSEHQTPWLVHRDVVREAARVASAFAEHCIQCPQCHDAIRSELGR